MLLVSKHPGKAGSGIGVVTLEVRSLSTPRQAASEADTSDNYFRM